MGTKTHIYDKYVDTLFVFKNKDGDERRETLKFTHYPDMEKRKESFWFDGEVAVLGKYILVAAGDIQVKFAKDDDWYKGDSAVFEAYVRRLTDEHLVEPMVKFENNNWFEVVGESGECGIGDVVYTFDEGIEMLCDYYREDSLGEYEMEVK